MAFPLRPPRPPGTDEGPEQTHRGHAGRRVAFFLDGIAESGVGEQVNQLTRGLIAEGARVTVICPAIPELDDYAARLQADGASILRLTLPSHGGALRGLREFFRFARFLRRSHTEVLHIHLVASDGGRQAMLAGWLARVPARICTRHITPAAANPPARFAPGRLFNPNRLLHRTIAVSRRARPVLAERLGVHGERVVAIPNSVRSDLFEGAGTESRARVRAGLGIPSDAPVIGCVARLAPQKGIPYLLLAMPRILQSAPGAHLVIVGDGPDRPAIERLIHESRLERVHLAGHQADVAPYLAAIDLFVLPSLFEGMPLALLEAMAAGLPVVATAVDGVPEVVESGITGELVPPRDIAALAATVGRLLSDPALAARLGHAGRERARSFSEDAMVARTAGVYEEVLAASQRHGGVTSRTASADVIVLPAAAAPPDAAIPPPLAAAPARPGERERSAPIARTAAALLSVQGISWMSSLVNVLAVPRFLGASDFGILSIATTAAMPLGLLAGFGASNHLVKVVARNPRDAASAVAHVVAVRLAFWFAAMLLITPLAFAFIGTSRDLAVLLVVFAGAAFGLIASAALAALQGHHALGKAALATSVIAVSGQLLTLAVLLAGGGLVSVAVLGTTIVAVGAIAALYLFWKELGGSFQWSRTDAQQLVRAGVPFLAWDVALFIYGSIGYLILGFLADSNTVGEYAFAYRLATIPAFFTTVVGAALFPSLASSIRDNLAWSRNAITNALRVIFAVTLPMACGIALVSTEMGEIIGGGKFGQAGLLVPVLAIGLPLIAVDTVLGTSLMARDMQGSLARMAWAASAFNIASNFLLISACGAIFDRPALGTAIATVLTEILMGVFVWWMMRAYIDFPRLLRDFGGSLASCLCLSAAVLLTKPVAGLLPAIAAGSMAFLVAALLLNVVRFDDLRWVRQSLTRRSEAKTWAV